MNKSQVLPILKKEICLKEESKCQSDDELRSEVGESNTPFFEGSWTLETYSLVILEHIHFVEMSSKHVNSGRKDDTYLTRQEIADYFRGFDMFLCETGIENLPLHFFKKLIPSLINASVAYLSKDMKETEFINVNFTLPFGYPEEQDLVNDVNWPTLRWAYQVLLTTTNFYFKRVPKQHPLADCCSVTNDREKLRALESYNEELGSYVLETVSKKHFLGLMMARMESEDVNERDTLKFIVHKLYGRFMDFRTDIQRAIFNNFRKIITNKFACVLGVSEQLEIFSSIAPGLVQPVKEVHLNNFIGNILSLIKCDGVIFFQRQLIVCIKKYIHREPKLANVVTDYLVRYWPSRNTKKQQFFLEVLNSVLEVLELVEHTKYDEESVQRHNVLSQKVLGNVLKLYQQNLVNDCYLVVEKLMLLWRSQYLMNLFYGNFEETCKSIVPELALSSENHWHQGIRNLCKEGAEMLKKHNLKCFEENKQRIVPETVFNLAEIDAFLEKQ